MRWRIAAIGSSQPLPPPARWARFTDFCRAPGRSDWSRRSGPWWRYGAGASGGNDLAVLLQAGSEAAQGAVWMRAAALDQDGVDPRQSCAERVDTDVAAEIAGLDQRVRQQRHAHVGGDAADHAVERAQFKPRGGRPAELRQRLLEPLPVSASGTEHQCRPPRLGRAGAQGGEAGPPARGHEDQLLPECRYRREFAVVDRTGDESAIARD